ncbi:MAG TPA: SBBP repeat-containing protein, partial [Thermomicrobiales bacterium]|nr:SBBP repeat-containing protein [Thermomicrobiales bacterium]
VDGSGNAYVTGKTSSANFPTANNPYQPTTAGGYDAFVAKFGSGGSLEYSTYLGGAGDDYGNGIAVDGSGDAYITGYTDSASFPTASPRQAALAGGNDAFVSELNSSGSLAYSTYLGGAGDDRGNGIAVNGSGDAYVMGYTLSADFPTSNPLQSAIGGGSDAFVTKFGAGGSLVYSTYLGGSASDVGNGMAVDGSGNAYVSGVTASANFPATNGSYQPTFASGGNDAFVAKVSAGGSLVYATYLGGSGDDGGYGIAADSSGDAYVTGYTLSTDFPASGDALQPANGGVADAFVTRFDSSGSLVYSSYLGGSSLEFGYGIAVDDARNAYITGQTSSAD